MEKNLMEIEQILREEGTVKAYSLLKEFLEKEPENAEAWYLMGGILRREQHWGRGNKCTEQSKVLKPIGACSPRN